MSIFAKAASIIASLSGLAQEGAGLGVDASGISERPRGVEGLTSLALNGSGDLGAFFVGNFGMMTADSFTHEYLRNSVDFGDDKARQRLYNLANEIESAERGLLLTARTLNAVQLLELTIGFAAPFEGASVRTGARTIRALSESLASTLPDERWLGTASENYAKAHIGLQVAALSMAKLDDQLADVVKDHADWVNHTHLVLGILKNLLTAAIFIELALIFAVDGGVATARLFAITVCTLGLAAAVGFILNLWYQSFGNKLKAAAITDQYMQLAVDVVSSDVAAGAASPQGRSAMASLGAVLGRPNAMRGGRVSALPATPRGYEGASPGTAALLAADDECPEKAQDSPHTTRVAFGSTRPASMPSPDRVAMSCGSAGKSSYGGVPVPGNHNKEQGGKPESWYDRPLSRTACSPTSTGMGLTRIVPRLQ
ncbi:EspA/EspE family type VII secretion system effector [Mycobacterium sp. 050134]|uniref:EspA/EspE family type VII secretion system effector n=1 Tax=Mycobacterium sp. 050134 TaxID=3096111 RepID=UPI002ED93442